MYIKKLSSGKTVLKYIENSDIINGKLTIPAVDLIADNLCMGRDDIIELHFEDGVKEIGTQSFANMPQLKLISKFSNNMESIGWGGFYGNRNLQQIPPLPDTLNCIGSWAFELSQIEKIKMNNWVSIGCSPFRNTKLSEVETNNRKYFYKEFKPFESCKDDDKIMEILMDSEIQNPIFNKRGLVVYKGINWRNTFMDVVSGKEERVTIDCYIAEYSENNHKYAGIGYTANQAIHNMRENFKKPEFYNVYNAVYSEKITKGISFPWAVRLYMGATGISKEDIGQFLMANGYMDGNWNPEQLQFSIKELACISRGKYGHKTFKKYMLGFMHSESYNTYDQGGHSYTFYGIEKDLHKCDSCVCLPRGCEFAKTLKTNTR